MKNKRSLFCCMKQCRSSKSHRQASSLFFTMLTLLWFCLPTPVHAYLDPGSGSMLLSAVIGILATLVFSVLFAYYRVVAFVLQLFGKKMKRTGHKVVFYSEGDVYWPTFKPILDALHDQQIEAVYLTSSETDPGLQYSSNHISTIYIGKGNRAYSYLNTLQADICVMTTPGLDVLQIKRSKGVRHYAHVVHSAVDISSYKLFSFDYYDSIFCSGGHQIKSIRSLEALRQIEQKQLFEAGCPYMDELAVRLTGFQKENPVKKTDKITVVVAPTWGPNGLLTRFGESILTPLADLGYDLIVRPHPQSYVSERPLIERLQQRYKDHPKIRWDDSPSNLEAFAVSDVLISDISGAVFDYAFIYEKPVLTIANNVDWRGYEANDLPHTVWELTVFDSIGRQIDSDDIARLPKIIAELQADKDMKTKLRKLRQDSLYNYGTSGSVIAKQLLTISQELV